MIRIYFKYVDEESPQVLIFLNYTDLTQEINLPADIKGELKDVMFNSAALGKRKTPSTTSIPPPVPPPVPPTTGTTVTLDIPPPSHSVPPAMAEAGPPPNSPTAERPTTAPSNNSEATTICPPLDSIGPPLVHDSIGPPTQDIILPPKESGLPVIPLKDSIGPPLNDSIGPPLNDSIGPPPIRDSIGPPPLKDSAQYIASSSLQKNSCPTTSSPLHNSISPPPLDDSVQKVPTSITVQDSIGPPPLNESVSRDPTCRKECLLSIPGHILTDISDIESDDKLNASEIVSQSSAKDIVVDETEIKLVVEQKDMNIEKHCSDHDIPDTNGTPKLATEQPAIEVKNAAAAEQLQPIVSSEEKTNATIPRDSTAQDCTPEAKTNPSSEHSSRSQSSDTDSRGSETESSDSGSGSDSEEEPPPPPPLPPTPPPPEEEDDWEPGPPIN